MRTVAVILNLLLSVLAWAQDFPLDQFQGFRSHQGLTLPQWDSELAASCSARARELVISGELSHEDAQGRNAAQQLSAAGFGPGVYGEVLAAGIDPERVWAAWLASPTHRAVLADRRWTAWAWAVQPAAGTLVWVVRFRAP